MKKMVWESKNLEKNQKKTKKTIWNRLTPGSSHRIVFFCFFGFPRLFGQWGLGTPKNLEKNQKKQKNQSGIDLPQILLTGLFFCFFWFFWFSSTFWTYGKVEWKKRKNMKKQKMQKPNAPSVPSCFSLLKWSYDGYNSMVMTPTLWRFRRSFPSPFCSVNSPRSLANTHSKKAKGGGNI